MKEEKYYTPSSEDLIVGLDYQYYTWKGWVDKTIDSLGHRPNGTMSLQYDIVLNKDKFRVKYLDRNDIESLGFKYDGGSNGTDEYVSENGREFILVIEDFVAILRSDSTYPLFKGKLKNKLELSKIIKITRR